MQGILPAESTLRALPPERSGRAVFACFPQLSRGRRVPEPESALRSAFQRDRDRVIHSTAFRRLKHKTQVFVAHESDHFRTRLTHSLEVSQIARTLARTLGLDEDLTECVALAHDLGHTCFGHAGEEALHAAMAPYGGFDHNAQTLRVLTKLECRHVGFDGLNLTWESLEGVVKHNGPLHPPLPAAVAEYVSGHDLELDTFPGAEAQVAALADDIAYNAHDLDDGLRAGLFGIDDLADLPLVGPTCAAIRARHPGIEPARLAGELVRRLVGAMVDDALGETRARIATARPDSADAIRHLDHPVVAFSVPFGHQMAAIKGFLFERMYRHPTVNEMTSKARRVVRVLFDRYMADPAQLPVQWQARAGARAVADYIAGMTDNFALKEHARLVGAAA
ncbi:MAG: deoxyguanosinetriphosphate triphosphohydrolase [Rhodospirillales bacterium]|nr:deoxyguanosinetriphosphate triphosphohydrolase [Rhodospirillales bacterium]